MEFSPTLLERGVAASITVSLNPRETPSPHLQYSFQPISSLSPINPKRTSRPEKRPDCSTVLWLRKSLPKYSFRIHLMNIGDERLHLFMSVQMANRIYQSPTMSASII